MDKIPQYGLVPFRCGRESDGFIFNRIWASIKRECLMIVQEGVARPEDVDEMWITFTRPYIPPCRLMDRVASTSCWPSRSTTLIAAGAPEGPRRFLREYIDQGRLGVKTGRGVYDEPCEQAASPPTGD